MDVCIFGGLTSTLNSPFLAACLYPSGLFLQYSGPCPGDMTAGICLTHLVANVLTSLCPCHVSSRCAILSSSLFFLLRGKRVKGERARRKKGDVGGSSGQRGWRERQSWISPGSPPSQLSKWLRGAACEGCVPHIQSRVPRGRSSPVESWDTQPHCFIEFGVWSIFVFYSPAVCVMTSFPGLVH